jgi:nucleoside-triphosphatase THEP1
VGATLILTGAIGSGKSTVAQRVLSLAKTAGLRCDGLVTPPRVDATGFKEGIDGIRLATGERRPLADRRVSEPGERCGIWRFYPGALDWALASLMEAIVAGPDLLILDEVGPMELLEGRGLSPTFPVLIQARIPLVLIIVREALLPLLEERLVGRQTRVYKVIGDARDELPEQIARDWFQRE